MVSPEKKATTSRPSISAERRMSVEKPCIFLSLRSRNSTIASFSDKSRSNNSREVPKKYADKSSYMRWRSAEDNRARGITEPSNRFAGASSKGGDVHVGKAAIKSLM